MLEADLHEWLYNKHAYKYILLILLSLKRTCATQWLFLEYETEGESLGTYELSLPPLTTCL